MSVRPIHRAKLSSDQGVELTLALGAAHVGDDYYNADVFGEIMHFDGRGTLNDKRAKDPEAFDKKVNNQIETLRDIVAPYVGMRAMAVHHEMGFHTRDTWEYWKPIYPRIKTVHTTGTILGVEGVVFERQMSPRGRSPADAVHLSLSGRLYKIGVVFDTRGEKNVNIGGEYPHGDMSFLPVRGLAANRKYFNGIWSNQIRGWM